MPQNGNSCAVLFEHERCSFCNGFRLEVQAGDMIGKMNAFVDDRVSSIHVTPGCELLVFKDPDFQGVGGRVSESYDFLPEVKHYVFNPKVGFPIDYNSIGLQIVGMERCCVLLPM